MSDGRTLVRKICRQRVVRHGDWRSRAERSRPILIARESTTSNGVLHFGQGKRGPLQKIERLNFPHCILLQKKTTNHKTKSGDGRDKRGSWARDMLHLITGLQRE